MDTTTHLNTNLAFYQNGDAGPPVLFIMGFNMRGRVWRELTDLFATDHRAVFFDNRGIGESDAPAGLYTMEDMAGDVRGLMDHLGWESAHIVGVSMGGMIAQEFTLRHPKRVRSLSLLATHAGGLQAFLPPLKGLQLFLQANLGSSDRIASLERLLFTPAYLATCDRAQLRARLEREFAAGPPPFRVRMAQLSAVLRHDTEDRLHQLAHIPTLIVRPNDDILIHPRQSDRLARLLPHAEVLALENCGHGLIRQVPNKLHEAISAMIARVEAT